jgi:hypothetical protein
MTTALDTILIDMRFDLSQQRLNRLGIKRVDPLFTILLNINKVTVQKLGQTV